MFLGASKNKKMKQIWTATQEKILHNTDIYKWFNWKKQEQENGSWRQREPGRCKTHWEEIKGRTREGERAEWKKEVRCVRGESGGHQVAAEGRCPTAVIREGEVIRWDSPYGSILRPTGAEGGRLGPSIISGGEGAPPLTGEGPYESPVMIRPSIYRRKTSSW